MANDRDTPEAPGGILESAKGFIKDSVGPLAAMEVAAWSFAKAMAGSALSAKKLQDALVASSGASALQKQLVGIGMAAGAARLKIEQIAKLSSSSSFSFAALGNASKILQTIGGSSLNTKSNLKKVMDSAAATGAPVENVAEGLARMYETLKRGGAGAGEAAAQLANMGVITQDTAIQIGRFAEAGANSAASLKLLEIDLKKSRGASDELAASLVGLQAKLEHMKTAHDIEIGKMFEDGAKSGARAAIEFEKVRETINTVGSGAFAPLINGLQMLKQKIAELVSSEPALTAIKGAFTVLSQVAVAVLGMMVGRLLFAGAQFAAWGYRMVKSIAGVSTAMELLGTGAARWTSWIGTMAGKTTILAAGISVLAARFYDLWEAMQAGPAENKKRMQENQDLFAKEVELRKTGMDPGSSTLEKSQAAGQAAGMVSDTEEQIKAAQERVQKAHDANEAGPMGWWKKHFSKKDKDGEYTPGLDLFQSVDGSPQAYLETQNAHNELEALKQRLFRQKELQETLEQSAAGPGGLSAVQMAALNTSKDGQRSRDMLIGSSVANLRVQQQFAPNGASRLGFKKEADNLEDLVSLRKRTQELEDSGADAKTASQIAGEETSRNRILSDIDQQGRPPVSDLARMGGSAGFAGVIGGPTQDQTKRIRELNEQIATDLQTLIEKVSSGQAKGEKLAKEASK